MPPLYAQDPLAAVQRGLEWSWLDVPLAVAGGAADPWVVALLALALYSWLEQEVSEVLASFLPLAVAMALAVGAGLLAKSLGAVPRPVSDAVSDGGSLLRLALEGANFAVAATFAAYSLLAYGRRAGASLAVALAAAGAGAAGGAGLLELAGAGLAGVALGASSHRAAVRLFPGGHLARLRRARRRPPDPPPAPPGA